MDTAIELNGKGTRLSPRSGGAPVRDACAMLRAGYTAAPILAGLDKFFDRMVVWDEYLAPAIVRRVPVSPRTFMKFVGVVEIAAGVLVATRKRGAPYVVAGWLGGIVTNLLLHPRRYADIALRDVGLMLGALALGRLEQQQAQQQRSKQLPTFDRRGMTTEAAVPLPQRLRPTLEDAPAPH